MKLDFLVHYSKEFWRDKSLRLDSKGNILVQAKKFACLSDTLQYIKCSWLYKDKALMAAVEQKITPLTNLSLTTLEKEALLSNLNSIIQQSVVPQGSQLFHIIKEATETLKCKKSLELSLCKETLSRNFCRWSCFSSKILEKGHNVSYLFELLLPRARHSKDKAKNLVALLVLCAKFCPETEADVLKDCVRKALYEEDVGYKEVMREVFVGRKMFPEEGKRLAHLLSVSELGA
jgi:hypothetical protein